MQVFHNRRVLLLTEEYPPVLGGIQNYLSELMDQLKPDHTIVITQKRNDCDVWDKEQKYKIIRVNMHGFSIPRWRSAMNVLEETVKEFKPEIIVCGKALFEGRAALKICKKYQIPYVVMTYGMEINTWLKTEKTKRDLLNVCDQAERIFVINDEIKTVLTNFLRLSRLAHSNRWAMAPAFAKAMAGRRKDDGSGGNRVDENKFVKMYPGVDEFYGMTPANGDEIATHRPSQPMGDGSQRRRHTIVSVCRLVHRKGIDVVINAVNEIKKKIPNIKYIIIGDGPEKTALEQLVKKLGLEDNVEFFGKASNEKILEVYQKSDLFVMTPRNEEGNMEGFGIVYLEAAMAGLCAVGSKSGGVPEAVLDRQTGLLANENDVDDTAVQVLKLLQDDGLRKQLGDNAKKRASDEFSWMKRAVLFRGVIESVVK